MAKDYYKTLGVDKSASEDEIRKAFRTLAKKYHPDVSNEPNAEEKFKEIQEAYAVLSDADKRSQYDRFGTEGPQFQGFEGFQGFDFGDIFSSFFGGGMKRESYGPERGSDRQTKMTLDFMEAALGCQKSIRVQMDQNCHVCHGLGGKSQSDVKTCATCHGSGFVTVQQQTLFGTMTRESTCPTCHGQGKTIVNKCENCLGSGREKVTKTIDVNIPAGVDDGMSLRVKGYGDDGLKGGPKGDLYITFKVKSHKVFKRRGNDIYLNLDLTYSQAALGTNLEIPTIYGPVDLKIPAGIQTGTSLRMRDKGIQTGSRKGNQYVVVNLKTPTNLSKDEKALFEKLSKLEENEKKTIFSKLKDAFK